MYQAKHFMSEQIEPVKEVALLQPVGSGVFPDQSENKWYVYTISKWPFDRDASETSKVLNLLH